jgi:glycosyltransferase involved in cell wall biosynthesis
LLAGGFAGLGNTKAILSLSTDAEILRAPNPPPNELPVKTYTSPLGLIRRLVTAPIAVRDLTRTLRRLDPQIAVCAMPGPLDLLMAAASRRARVPIGVIVHDAEPHPGDGFPLLFKLQDALLHRADLVIALSSHVAARLKTRAPILVASLPPLALAPAPPRGIHAGPRRVLCFGRLLAYKGLDLLAEALRLLGTRQDMEVRIVGQGPESAALAALRALTGVTVENRWVPEGEVDTLLEWADIVVLPYREASQSGIAPTALAAGRHVVATRVGGLPEQLGAEPLATLCEPEATSLAEALACTVQSAHAPAPPASDPNDAWRRLAATVLDGATQRRGPCRLP